jgi:hypothetical protein
VTDNTTSLIDLIFEYNVEDIVCHGTLPKIADHEGILVSYNIDCQKPKSKTKTIYDYKNADVNGLINHIKHFDFETAVFHHPKTEQAQLYSKVFTDAFALFVPCKTVIIRTNDQPWTNTYTRLLLRKKNRHYRFYKKVNSEYIRLSNRNNIRPEILTKYLEKKNKAFDKSKDAANNSKMANRRAKLAFINSVNATMNNYSISAKKKFNILQKLMKNNKFSPTPPLLEIGETISEPKEKSEIFNSFFASKSTVNDPESDPPYLQKLLGVPNLDNLNTSPLEVGKFIRGLKKSHSSHRGIPGQFLQLISCQISNSLSKLFNNLFEIGHFPEIWKLAHITAVAQKKWPKKFKNQL